MITGHISSHHAVQGEAQEMGHLLRKMHRAWSDATFGAVGPVGPLKHLAKEALEAAEAPGDITEYVDCMFLLWDAVHRAGFTEAQLIQAGFAKLDVLKARVYRRTPDGVPSEHVRD